MEQEDIENAGNQVSNQVEDKDTKSTEEPTSEPPVEEESNTNIPVLSDGNDNCIEQVPASPEQQSETSTERNNCSEQETTEQRNEEESNKKANESSDESTETASTIETSEIVEEAQQKSPNDSDKENNSNVDNNDNNKDNSVEKESKVVEEAGSEVQDRSGDESNNLNDSASSKGFDNYETDDDFDPSLLCPEVSMNVDENEVINSNGQYVAMPSGSTSPLLFDTMFSTLVDEMTGAEVMFNLTPEEEEIRERSFGPDKPIKFTSIHCSACNLHLGTALAAQKNRFVHPMLKVLVCKDCYHFYTSGEFEKDEDGSELYCRWCGQGGQVICCSKCEFVFCKKCIRRNFGPRKVKSITDSDDWECFRCNPRQLSYLRAVCAELFDYVRTELSRTSGNDVEALSKDYSPCCQNAVKRLNNDGSEPVPKKRKRRTSSTDPDYDPSMEDIIDITESIKTNYKQNIAQNIQPLAVKSAAPLKLINSVPSSTSTSTTSSAPPQLLYLPQSSTPIQLKSIPGLPLTQFRIIRPANVRPNTGQPFIIRGLPPNSLQGGSVTAGTALYNPMSQSPLVRAAPPPLTPKPTLRPPIQRTTVQRVRFVGPRSAAPHPLPQPLPQFSDLEPRLKHEWFEKTVRAAARVNSNLSYTLTQLNRFQSKASSVKDLAIVHNKLQEVLSNSINTLIQIRKNLHTDFVAGVKAIKMKPIKPSKPTKPAKPVETRVESDDDDVIFVDPEKSVTVPVPVKVNETVLKSVTPGVGTTYLKVRPMSALLNMPKEYIAVPNSPPPLAKKTDPPPLLSISGKEAEAVKQTTGMMLHSLLQNKNGVVPTLLEEKIKTKEMNEVESSVESEVVVVKDEPITVEEEFTPTKEPFVISNVETVADEQVADTVPKAVANEKKSFNPLLMYNVKKFPSPTVKRMMSAKIRLERNDEMESRIKKEFSLGKNKS